MVHLRGLGSPKVKEEPKAPVALTTFIHCHVPLGAGLGYRASAMAVLFQNSSTSPSAAHCHQHGAQSV